MLQRNDLSLALRTAARVQDPDVPRLSASVSIELARAITESPEEPAETATGDDGVFQRPAAARRVRHRRVVRAMALAAVAALAVTLFQTFGGAAPAAFADWQPVPQLLTGAAAQHQIDECPYFGGAVGIKIPVGARTLVEQRGRMVFIVFAGGGELGSCMLLDGRGDGAGESGLSPRPTGSDIVSDGGGGSFTFDASGTRVDTTDITGLAGPQVSSILIHRTDGVVVTAAVHDGLWAAWWPGNAAAATLTVQTRDGRSHDLPATASR
jgi:hypothetical protein